MRLPTWQLTMLAAVVGCSSPVAVELGETVTLAPGQVARIAGYDLELTFVGVPADSRCPTGDLVQCVWAGDATVSLRVAGPAGAADLEVHTHPDYGRVAQYATLQIALDDLTPIPTTDGPPGAGTYRAQLTILPIEN